VNSQRVLLVDDDTSLLEVLGIRLRRNGYEVLSAADIPTALAVLSSFKADVMIVDLRLGPTNGLELLDRVKEVQPSLAAIVLTAHGTIPDAVSATTRGAFAFLTKPFDPDVLLGTVKEACALAGVGHDASSAGDDAWHRDIVTRSPRMLELLEQARRAARSDVSIVLESASGTGKELLAKAIHRASERCARAFVAVNCTAIPESLFESEFFGYCRGAFTGATRDRAGLFQAADGGTLFLDEIGDMPLHFQAKLLRVLQEREVRRVGASTAEPVDVRVVAATHQDLDAAVASGRFREDLYYRLNVVVLQIPPLEERREDIVLLAETFLAASSAKGVARAFAPDAKARLVAASWPGNVRQLRNVVEQCVVLATGPVVPASLVERALRGKSRGIRPLNEALVHFEHVYLVDLLRLTDGNVTLAARLAGRNRSEFYKLLGRHRLEPQRFREDSDGTETEIP
jgi:two-component system response regulator GlrR